MKKLDTQFRFYIPDWIWLISYEASRIDLWYQYLLWWSYPIATKRIVSIKQNRYVEKVILL